MGFDGDQSDLGDTDEEIDVVGCSDEESAEDTNNPPDVSVRPLCFVKKMCLRAHPPTDQNYTSNGVKTSSRFANLVSGCITSGCSIDTYAKTKRLRRYCH